MLCEERAFPRPLPYLPVLLKAPWAEYGDRPAAVRLARDLEAHGWLREAAGFERSRLYRYQPYLDLFHRETLQAAFAPPAEPLAGTPAF